METIPYLHAWRLKRGLTQKALASRAGLTQAQISYWDALIVAAALLSGCDTLYTEDLEQGRTFDGQLTVVNPFVAA